ncbi:MAG: efflux transporter outer membrane subunit [Leptospiraceae bacterium]|nr:efflux transporter outer membrane subunit [Leptospiraceae bacterium]MCP5494432.1 efflux transporter outer membrane subunit [Leptospiraceae bacterium]
MKHKKTSTINSDVLVSLYNSLVKAVIFPIFVTILTSCLSGPAIDLAPEYKTPKYVVPDSWHGSGPFVKAKPSEGKLRPDWWKLYKDPVLNKLEKEAMKVNPKLEAAAERFNQARYEMLKVRSQLIPNIGLGIGGSNNKQSSDSLFRGIGEPNRESTVSVAGLASWEPDFWSKIRNRTKMQIYNAEQLAAEYSLVRLSLQAELASDYFTLRGLDAQDAMYSLSIKYYKKTQDIVKKRFSTGIVPKLDVLRANYMLANTKAKRLDIQNKRQVTLHAIAILVNRSPSTFSIKPKDKLLVANFKIPTKLPATLLERRPDIAAMERQMAQANRSIGIAKAAFFPNVSFGANGGYEAISHLFSASHSFWSYGSLVSLPFFQGGYRRAQLQKSWSAYRETEDLYRSTVLNAFREVENALTQTNFLSKQAKQQDIAVDAALKTQDMTMELYKGGLGNSLDILYAQETTLAARINAITVKTDLLRATTALIRALGGGWNRNQLPVDDEIQPMDIFQYRKLGKPKPAGHTNVNAEDNSVHNNLTKPISK